MSALVVERLTVRLPGPGRAVIAEANLEVRPGEILALVGESGAGKSVFLQACCGLTPPDWPVSGRIALSGRGILTREGFSGQSVLGRLVVPVLQDPQAGLSAVRRVGDQIADALRLAGRGADAVPGLLEEVGLAPAVARMRAAALSGGMAQRVGLVRALATGAALVLADEPTSALDGPSARLVLAQLARARDAGRAVVLVTHDPALATLFADRMAVLHQGRIVEQGRAGEVLHHPRNPVSQAMMAALPARVQALADSRPAAPGAVVLALRGLGKAGRGQDGLSGIDLDLRQGEVVAVCGASGAGKTTLARLAAVLDQADRGAMVLAGRALGRPAPQRFSADPDRRRIQMAFQDGTAGFFPHQTCRATIRQAMARFGLDPAPIDGMARQCGLDPAALDRMPGALSQGQRARAGLVRAIAVRPDVLVLDEPTAALDAPHQLGVLRMLDRLRADGVGILLVTHDLHAARLLARRVIVLDSGRIVEQGPVEDLLRTPRTAAARALVAAMA